MSVGLAKKPITMHWTLFLLGRRCWGQGDAKLKTEGIINIGWLLYGKERRKQEMGNFQKRERTNSDREGNKMYLASPCGFPSHSV